MSQEQLKPQLLTGIPAEIQTSPEDYRPGEERTTRYYIAKVLFFFGLFVAIRISDYLHTSNQTLFLIIIGIGVVMIVAGTFFKLMKDRSDKRRASNK